MVKDHLSPSLPILELGLSPEWEAMVEAMEDGICVQSLDSRILRANRAFAAMLGLPMEQIVGHTCAEVFGCVGEKSTPPPFCARAASYASGRCESEEILGRNPGQRLRARVSPVRDCEGRIAAYVMVVRDITDVIRRERELARAKQLSLLGELAAGLAHEIKNPLAGIQGAIDILILQREPGDPDRSVLEGVRREVRRIDATVHALLDCARPRALNTMPTSLTEVVGRAVQLARDQIAGGTTRDRQICIEFEPTVDPILLPIDAEQVEDAVLNLILNAVEAIDGDGRITVRIYRQDNSMDQHGEAVVEVEDTGRGIATDNLVRIFSLFFTTKRNGTGLGLPTVRRIARAHGGRIEVKSTVGSGSIFTFRLPLSASRRL